MGSAGWNAMLIIVCMCKKSYLLHLYIWWKGNYIFIIIWTLEYVPRVKIKPMLERDKPFIWSHLSLVMPVRKWHSRICQNFDDTRLHNVPWLHIKWKKSNCGHQEDKWGSQRDWISGETILGGRGEDSDRRRGGRPRQHEFKNYVCVQSLPGWLLRCPHTRHSRGSVAGFRLWVADPGTACSAQQ